ncbi:hypothetical protein FACS1894109_00410 [Spirochaetia bacterium]|nr:hypothetical protein FACS1894109_00410 [Spirochaetia bacterium]
MKRYSEVEPSDLRSAVREKRMWVEDWKESGKSRYTYAKRNGLNPATLNNWVREAEGPQDKAKIYIRPGHTDMRKAVNGLTLLVKEKWSLLTFTHGLAVPCLFLSVRVRVVRG